MIENLEISIEVITLYNNLHCFLPVQLVCIPDQSNELL